ncbi:MAG TPA: hypothetical protein VG797_06715 [Phycisphaerales bacterium]|nr:hypothetical protein [Phycisphaerales bacterium]
MNDAWSWKLSDQGYSVRIDCDSRVSYAYLLKGTAFVGDVWLTNTDYDPDEIPWDTSHQEMPFRNPKEYTISHEPLIDPNPDDFVFYSWHDKGSLRVAILYLGQPLAILGDGIKPGWCVFAKKRGPLAQPLLIDVRRNNQDRPPDTTS